MELENLLHSAIDLAGAFASAAASEAGASRAPDGYALWLLGQRLETLCASKAPGDLDRRRLVVLLHLFAHPSLRSRIPARCSAQVLRHAREALPNCSVGELAQLLQAYADSPAAAPLVSDTIILLATDLRECSAGATSKLDAAGLPELAAIAGALRSRAPPLDDGSAARAAGDAADVSAVAYRSAAVDVARAVLQRLPQALAAANPETSLEVAVLCLEDVLALRLPEEVAAEAPLPGLIASLGARLAEAPSAPGGRLSSDAAASLLCLQLQQPAAKSAGGAAAEAAAWPKDACKFLQTRLAELSPRRLADLACALANARANPDIDGQAFFESLLAVATTRANLMPAEEISAIGHACASAGLSTNELFSTFDVEASLTKPLSPSALAALSWTSAVELAAGGTAEHYSHVVFWEMLSAQFNGMSEATRRMIAPADQALLYESLTLSALLRQQAWDPDCALSQYLASDEWRAAWNQRREQVAPASPHGDKLASTLDEMGIRYTRGKQDSEELYVMPFVLTDEKVIIDLMVQSTRHPISGEVRGDVLLRQALWTDQGYSILAIADTTWAKVASEGAATDASIASENDAQTKVESRPAAWLREKLESLRRVSIVRATDLPEQIAQKLEGVPFGGENGLRREVFESLALQSTNVQNYTIKKFMAKWHEETVKYPSALFNSILTIEARLEKEKLAEETAAREKKEKEREAAKERAAASFKEKTKRVKADPAKNASSAAAANSAEKKPTSAAQKSKKTTAASKSDGTWQWNHPDAKPLSAASVGQILAGPVTNVVYGRVWVNCGFQQDATFLGGKNVYKVGAFLEGLKVLSVDESENRLEVRPTAATRAARKKAADAEKAPSTDAGSDAAAAQKPAASAAKAGSGDAAPADAAETTRPKKARQVATVTRPEAGWKHEDARALSEFQIGQVVSGKVTNVLMRRVWLDVGAVKDAMLFAKDNTFKVGDSIEDLVVTQINFDKEQLQVRQQKNDTADSDEASEQKS
eukprot:TRINITY_DN14902_c0_g2_i1.p1 TRINITY_DN14902_c0_g2~~TRINITY_DN14902_c0_g2_i1.p1  ORF type:complete len:1151 (-),score=298.27 TRINITY_DN14902_c0_g2_i1:111-3095(-)